uniref:Major facilitator superfamily (MFS) profile domain-containing protein n=1 Tax=Branchiostoma floridae TaxID=7739 RepID=C3XVU9_BRAFL|eukprot:XP_002611883.1 hypothetical protein BRAFLDRAFT_83090 [Branchiostoma floridae]
MNPLTEGGYAADLEANQAKRRDGFRLPIVKFRRRKEDDENMPGKGEYENLDEVSSHGEVTIDTRNGDLRLQQLEKDTSEDTFTVEDAVEAIGFGRFQIKLSVLTGLSWMADAMEMMILSILSPQLLCEWQLSSWQEAFITTIVFIGMMVSSSMWGNICDRYGRRLGLFLCAVWIFFYGILSAFSPTYIWIVLLRGIVGFGIGGVPQSVTLYAEFLPRKQRAQCVVFLEIFWAIGTCIEVVLALIVMPTLGWRWLLLFSAIPCLIFAVSCKWLPESARYHVACGESEKAHNTLKKIALENNSPMPLGKHGATRGYGLLVTMLIIEWLGRKRTMALEFVVFAFFTFLLLTCGGRTWLTIFIFIGRAFISGAFQAAYVYTPEIYPTTTRALGLGTCSGVARLGALITPFVAQGIPSNAERLLVKFNNIASVTKLPQLPKLQVLNLGRNSIESFSWVSFRTLPCLKYLYLNYNQLRYVRLGSVIEYLPKLTHVDVSFNKLTSLSEYEVGLPQVTAVWIEGNPFHCDCNLSWLIGKMVCLQACKGKDRQACCRSCSACFVADYPKYANRAACNSPSRLNRLPLSNVSTQLTCELHQSTTRAAMAPANGSPKAGQSQEIATSFVQVSPHHDTSSKLTEHNKDAGTNTSGPIDGSGAGKSKMANGMIITHRHILLSTMAGTMGFLTTMIMCYRLKK